VAIAAPRGIGLRSSGWGLWTFATIGRWNDNEEERFKDSMMRNSTPLAAVAMLLLAFQTGAAEQPTKCVLQKYAELPVTLQGTIPLVTGRINGVELKFLADSGAMFSMLTKETAKNLKVSTTRMPRGMWMMGVGGEFDAQWTKIKGLELNGISQPLQVVDALV